tara:strand:+ start:1798 stop:2034 length:237 start_codon:yes stop_codon:yes gene_type:complete
MTSRRLPQTPSLLKNENSALKNRVECLNDALEESYSETNNLREIIKKLKREKESLKTELLEVKQILQYREEFIEEHYA